MAQPCTIFCGRAECFIGWNEYSGSARWLCRHGTTERYYHSNKPASPTNPKRTTAMIPKSMRIEFAAKRVAAILGVNWEICNKGTRARCYQIARDCFERAKDDWMPPPDDAPAPPIMNDEAM